MKTERLQAVKSHARSIGSLHLIILLVKQNPQLIARIKQCSILVTILQQTVSLPKMRQNSASIRDAKRFAQLLPIAIAPASTLIT